MPTYAKIYWPALLVYLKENDISTEHFYFVWTMCQHFFFSYLFNGILSIFYYFEFAFIEQFKAVEEEWPWKTNKEEWIKLLKKSLVVTNLNAFLCITALQSG